MTFFFALLFSVVAQAAEIQFPALTSPIVDEAGLLGAQERQEIESWLYSYRRSGKAQIQVVTVKSLGGLPIEQYSIQLVEKWKLGGQKTDDGVLFLIAPQDRAMRIEVGQGLEGALTDLQSKRILDDRVRPLFREEKYALGIAAGVHDIIQAVDPEYAGQPDPAPQTRGKTRIPTWVVVLMILFLIFGGGGRRRRGFMSGAIAGGLLGGMGRGGGFGGGGGGGGWSGGGGGFSGGGASSNW